MGELREESFIYFCGVQFTYVGVGRKEIKTKVREGFGSLAAQRNMQDALGMGKYCYEQRKGALSHDLTSVYLFGEFTEVMFIK